jgi:hypothetical protein
MVRVPREGERVEPQRVDRSFLQQRQGRICSRELRQVEIEDVMPDDDVGSGTIVVEVLERRFQVSATVNQRAWCTRRDGGEREDPVRGRIDFEIDGNSRPYGTLAIRRFLFRTVLARSSAPAQLPSGRMASHRRFRANHRLKQAASEPLPIASAVGVPPASGA